jgi:hypothetical protein
MHEATIQATSHEALIHERHTADAVVEQFLAWHTWKLGMLCRFNYKSVSNRCVCVTRWYLASRGLSPDVSTLIASLRFVPTTS